MYIIDDELPKDCFSCIHRTKCNIWEEFMTLSIDEADIRIDTLKYFKPMEHRCCKYVVEIPSSLVKFYNKFILMKCPHLCKGCRHKNKCDIYNIGR